MIEVTVALVATVALHFDVEPGTVVTDAMVSEKINSMQAHIDRYSIDGGDYPAYVNITGYKNDDPIDLYDRQSGIEGSIVVGQAAEVITE